MNIEKLFNGKLLIAEFGNKTLYMSYGTEIAFKVDGKLTISQNEWDNTTGKHLNFINPDKSIRIPHKEFIRKALDAGF